jgi:ABC-type multidrug transport system ATPase subunit
MKQKGKIYLLIGYLGSGKTTLIRTLLQKAHT